MLLEFKASNYKSFKDEFVFSLIPAPKQKGLDYSILESVIGNKSYKGLCSAVIYGPNAAGKSNIIGAMDTFKSIVLRGNIRNNDDKKHPNVASSLLELIPNILIDDQKPVVFSIKFLEKGIVVEYSFSIDLGNFLDEDYSRKILKETLIINEQLVFSRDNNLNIYPVEHIIDFLVNDYEKNKQSVSEIARNSLNDEELFLMNGFKTMFSSKLISLITNWLEKKFIIIYRADAMYLSRKFSDITNESFYVEKTVNEAASIFGINSSAIGFRIKDENSKPQLYSVVEKNNGNVGVPSKFFESYGTLRFIDRFPLVVDALLNGGTLVVDEFDSSIHPMALMSIINIFHNDDINTKNAQFVFNTHNPIFLNANLFRRDEIKFVECSEETHCSTHYSLSDFGTAGKHGVRNNEDYLKNYFVDKYGAIKDIDFTPFFEKLMEEKREEVN